MQEEHELRLVELLPQPPPHGGFALRAACGWLSRSARFTLCAKDAPHQQVDLLVQELVLDLLRIDRLIQRRGRNVVAVRKWSAEFRISDSLVVFLDSETTIIQNYLMDYEFCVAFLLQ